MSVIVIDIMTSLQIVQKIETIRMLLKHQINKAEIKEIAKHICSIPCKAGIEYLLTQRLK